MKTANFSKFLAVSLIVTVGAVGCRKTPKNVTHIPTVAAPVTGPEKPSGPTGPTRPTDRPPVEPVNRTPDPGPGAGVPIVPGPGPTSTNIPTGPDGLTPLPDSRSLEGNYIVDREQFKEQMVYFDFDSSTVKPSEKPKAESVATFLKSNATFRLRIEGHCDERGTDEYNRALGERRALSVREYLISAGVSADRVSTLSFGEDQPAVLGHDEMSWAKNRRGEFILLKPKS